jgi:hypothetical protein
VVPAPQSRRLTDLIALTPLVHSLAERHLTYPVLQYFHSGRRERTSTALTLVVLDEALTLLRSGVAPAARPDPTAVDPVVRAVGWYLDTVQGALVTDAADPVPPADLEVIRQSGIPTVDDDEYLAAAAEQEPRRRQLTALVVDEGWRPEAWERRRQTIRAGDGRPASP